MRFNFFDHALRIAFVLSVSTLFLLSARPAFSSPSVDALELQIEQIRRERAILVEEQRRLEAELEAINKESQTLSGAIKSLNATRKKLEADIKATQLKITSSDLAIRSLENTIMEKERQIDTHRRAIANIISTLSEYDSRSIVFDLLAAQNFSEIWDDRNHLENLNIKLKDEINSLRETRRELDVERAEREKIKEEQISLREQLSGQRSVVTENQKAQERLLAETKNREVEYQRLLQENIANQKRFEEDLYELESQLRIILDPSLFPEARNGALSWPLDNIFITQRFGNTEFAKSGGYLSKTHNGVDFRAAMGTPVKAMLSGTIQGAGNTDEKNTQLRREGRPICGSYGRWILIKHNNGLSSLYAHLSSSIVRIGQEVKTGEVIGYSGGQPGVNGSGYSTAPHLHVSLFASQGVEIRLFTNSLNCKHISVPIADPKAYLNPLAYLPVL